MTLFNKDEGGRRRSRARPREPSFELTVARRYATSSDTVTVGRFRSLPEFFITQHDRHALAPGSSRREISEEDQEIALHCAVSLRVAQFSSQSSKPELRTGTESTAVRGLKPALSVPACVGTAFLLRLFRLEILRDTSRVNVLSENARLSSRTHHPGHVRHLRRLSSHVHQRLQHDPAWHRPPVVRHC